MSTISPMTSRRWAPHALAVAHSPIKAEPMTRLQVEPGPRTLVGSTHSVCLCSNADGRATARGEWDLAFARDIGERVTPPEHVRFRVDATQLRILALAMLAGARELDAIEAHVAADDREGRIDPDYLETITLTEHGVDPSCESPLYIEAGR